MDRRERVVDRKADEILKKFTSDIVKIYDEEAKEQRVKALTHGVQVLTEYETAQAFLQGKDGDVSPVSLHELYKKEVTA